MTPVGSRLGSYYGIAYYRPGREEVGGRKDYVRRIPVSRVYHLKWVFP